MCHHCVLALTQWGAPVSTSFLVLSSFKPGNIGTLLESSFAGYVLAFGVGLAAYGLGLWLLERWVFRRTQEGKGFNRIWYGLQWCSTGFLWSMWLVQDLANIFVYLPRRLEFVPMATCTVVLCIGLCLLVASGGGPIRCALKDQHIRPALGDGDRFCLRVLSALQAFLSSFPLSTTWVFLGQSEDVKCVADQKPGSRVCSPTVRAVLAIIGSDLWKATIAVLVSLGIALVFSL